MVTLRLVGQHVLVDIATTIHLCEGGGCVSGEGVGGVEDVRGVEDVGGVEGVGGVEDVEGVEDVGGVVKENVTYSGGDCFQVGVVCLYSEM